MIRPLIFFLWMLPLGGLWGQDATPFDIDFHAMDSAAALRTLARQAGINLVVSDGVKGPISLQLRQTDGLHAIEAVARARGLVLVAQGQVWWVGPQTEWMAIEKGRQEVRALMQGQQPLTLRTYRLHHARAVDWLDHLQGHAVAPDSPGRAGAGLPTAQARAGASSARWLSPRGQAMADARTNHLVVLDIPEVQERVALWVAELDVPQRQVQIEARIVEASEGFGRTLGARLHNPSDRWALDWAANPLGGLSPARAVLTWLGPSQSSRILAQLSALEQRGQGR